MVWVYDGQCIMGYVDDVLEKTIRITGKIIGKNIVIS